MVTNNDREENVITIMLICVTALFSCLIDFVLLTYLEWTWEWSGQMTFTCIMFYITIFTVLTSVEFFIGAMVTNRPSRKEHRVNRKEAKR